MIYSVVPNDIIFQAGQEASIPATVSLEGGIAEVDGDQRVTRLITTDLSLYLKVSPGSKINYKK